MKTEYSYENLMLDIAEASKMKKSFGRILEPSAVTDAAASVEQYNQVLETNITVNYSLTLDLLHRARPDSEGFQTALDLCPGPGHLSLCIAEHLGYSKLIGVDFSTPMVRVANENARKNELGDRATFVQGDAKTLEFETARFDLLTFTNAAHHFDSVTDIGRILVDAERVVKADGLIVLTDLARLPTPELTENFVRLAGFDYIARGMKEMFEDFRSSMFAAFTPDEMVNAVPRNSDRIWTHLLCGGLPFFQALVGLPVGRSALFLRESRDWKSSGLLRSEAAKAEWEILRGALYAGAQTQLTHPRSPTARKAS